MERSPVNGSEADKRSKIKLCMAFVPRTRFAAAACSVEQCGGSASEQEADARLIAAAPELLGALTLCIARLEEYADATDGIALESARSAIAKARGKQ